MTLQNPGFETAGASPGLASNWTLNVVRTAASIAVYTHHPSDPALVGPSETFEGDWTTNEAYIYGFTDPVTQLSAAQYTTVLPSSKFVENFDELWSSNESAVFDLTLSEQAMYDADPFVDVAIERFTGGWLSGGVLIDTLTDGVNASAASYDIAVPEAFEDFEEDWFSGFATTLTGSAANYDASPEAFED